MSAESRRPLPDDDTTAPAGMPDAAAPVAAAGDPPRGRAGDDVAPRRARPKPGERRVQILRALAAMLEQPRSERVTTAALAARLHVSEAALYRHFASKAQMFDGLIELIESMLLALLAQIEAAYADGLQRLRAMVEGLLRFAERNPGMTRVLVGDALVTEDDRLQRRINGLVDRIEASLREAFRVAVGQRALPEDADADARAGLTMDFVVGRWSRFAKSGFARLPAEGAERVGLLLAR